MTNRASSVEGLSFREFAYQMLQAYDFWHLHKHHNCRLQIGGADQWGNIVTGLDLIQRQREEAPPDINKFAAAPPPPPPPALGLTTTLLVNKAGEKLGKSAGNAIWLDPTQTSVYDFYQVRSDCPSAATTARGPMFKSTGCAQRTATSSATSDSSPCSRARISSVF